MLNIIGNNMHDILVAAFTTTLLGLLAYIFISLEKEEKENDRQI